MCSRYYLEPSSELLPVVERTRRCRLTENMIIHLGRPLKKDGIVSPDDMVPVIAPDRYGNRKEFPMVWGFHIEGLEKPVINARVENAKGKAEGKSDVDLLISTETTGLRFFEITERLREALHKKVDLLDIKQLVGNENLLKVILKEGIKVYG